MGLKLATTYTLIAIMAVVAVMIALGRRAKPTTTQIPVRGDDLDVWPFAPMPFMTDSEVRFFARLQDALPEYFIFAQVQLSRLIECTDPEDAKFWFNRINRMSADYVIVHRDAKHVLAVIELDDWTHDRPDRRRADQKKNKAIESAGLPLVRFDGRKMPEVAQIRRQIIGKMQKYGTFRR